MQTGSRAVLAVVVGLAVGTGGYWLAGDALIAANLVLVYAILAWLFAGHYGEIPDGADWSVNRWNGLLGGLPALVLMPFLNNRLGISLAEGFTLASLAFGLAYTTFLIGVVMVREAQSDGLTETREADSGVENAS